jgi:hypothetical protein
MICSRFAPVALLAAACGCSRYEPGLSVSIELGAATPAQARWTTARGGSFSAGTAHAVVGWIELLACPEAAWSTFFIGTAHAHSDVSPTRLDAPAVIDLTTGSVMPLGRLEPPPGSYCAVHLALAPAGDHAVGIDREPSMLGRTLDVRGTLTTSTAGQPWSVETPAFREGQVGIDPALTVDADAPSATLRLWLAPEEWLDQWEPCDQAPGAEGPRLLERLITTARAELP